MKRRELIRETEKFLKNAHSESTEFGEPGAWYVDKAT